MTTTQDWGASKFAYDESNSFITLMTTPYGSTAFHLYTPPFSGPQPRGLRIVFPDGTFTVHESWIGFTRATYFWDREATKRYPADPANNDYSHAERTEWLKYPTTNEMSAVPWTFDPPLESVTTYAYSGQSGAFVGSSNNPISISRTTSSGTQTSTFQYNSFGHVTQSVDPIGRELTFDYATNGIDLLDMRQTRSTNDDWLGQWKNYNSQHLPATYVDGSGQETDYTYNSFGQVATITDALGNVTTFNHDADGFLTSINGPLSGTADTTTFAYDSVGRVESVTDSEGYAISFEYDNADRLTRVVYPDGSFEQTIWDKQDPVLSRDRIGRWTQRSFDSMDQLRFVTDLLGRKTQYTWCSCGAMKTLTDPKGQTTTWNHDLQGRVIEKVFADSTSIDYVWDSNTSRLQSKTDALNQTTNYSYNLDDTLSGISYTNAVNPTSSVSFTYSPDYKRISTVGPPKQSRLPSSLASSKRATIM